MQCPLEISTARSHFDGRRYASSFSRGLVVTQANRESSVALKSKKIPFPWCGKGIQFFGCLPAVLVFVCRDLLVSSKDWAAADRFIRVSEIDSSHRQSSLQSFFGFGKLRGPDDSAASHLDSQGKQAAA